MIKTYLDSGVVLTAWRSLETRAEIALAVMEDPNRVFYTSQFARLELIPKARFHKQREEIEFYEAHFARADNECLLSEELGNKAANLAGRYGLAAADALHLAAAIEMGVEEFITTEKFGKPMFRLTEVSVLSLERIAI
jgi:predicted nucleic acid-binding protein